MEEIKPQDIVYKPLLSFSTCPVKTAQEGHRTAVAELERAGVKPKASLKGWKCLKTCMTACAVPLLLIVKAEMRIDGMGERGRACQQNGLRKQPRL